jgi:hypothetical protein
LSGTARRFKENTVKRILLIDHPQFTSATNYLWQGLKELEEIYPDQLSISCYPYIPTNYDEDKCELKDLQWFNWLEELVESSKKNAGQLPNGIPPFHKDERLTSQGETFMMRGNYWRRFEKAGVLADEVSTVRALREGKFDLVILGNSHRVPTILLGRLKELVQNFPPVVYFDAGERDELNEHWIHVFRPDLVFKQILTPEVKAKGLSVKIQGYQLKIYPLPLSSPIVGSPGAELEGLSFEWLREQSRKSVKMLPVFYALGNTWPERENVTRALDQLSLRKDLSRIKRASYLNYHIIMAKSRMAVTMRGSGRDTNHYWEIPLYRTAMICDGTMGCIHPYPFEDQKTAIFYRSIQQLVEIVERHLPEDGYHAMELNRIATNGQEHLEKYHSTAARAVFFLDILEKELNFFDQSLKEVLVGWKALKRWEGRPWEGPSV